MLSPHPADPTLTTDNLMEVVKEVEHHWEDLGRKLGLRLGLSSGLPLYRLSGVRGMAEVVEEYVRRYPTPSWKGVTAALQGMKLDKLADDVTTKYVRGVDVNHVTYLIQILTDFIIHLTHANVWESMGKPCSCMQFIKSRIFYCKSRENPYQYYKSCESVSGTASHARCI